MRRLYASAALTSILAVAGAAWISARDAKVATLTPQDYADIQHLTSRLNQGADSHDADMWVSLWTPDGVWTPSVGPARSGHAGLREYRRARREELGGRMDIRHWTNSLVITPSAEGATGRLYFMMMRVNVTPPVPASSGHYDDVYVKTADGWRIKRRTIQTYAPNTSTQP
jgi:ketosteroid isomerase-like protein